MLIVKVDKGGIERAIKKLRSKVRNVKQLRILRENKQFVKPSEKKRLKKQKAIYIQRLKDENEQ
jgi:small subunit ribosomal protein S21